jgi:hypothetical protein
MASMPGAPLDEWYNLWHYLSWRLKFGQEDLMGSFWCLTGQTGRLSQWSVPIVDRLGQQHYKQTLK